MTRIQSTRHQQSGEERRGAAIVEMAVVLPLFVLLVFGMIEFGRALMVSQLLTNAAREAARVAVSNGATNDDVVDSATDFLQEAIGVDPGDVTVDITITADPGNPDPGNDVSAAQPGDRCTVVVTVPFDEVTLTRADYMAGRDLIGYCTMRREW